MKLAFSVHVDVDETVFSRSSATSRDQLTENIRSQLNAAADALPIPLREVRVWGRATPTRQPPMTVVSVQHTRTGQYQVIVRAEDGRTSARTFSTWHDANAWAGRIDPLPLPAHDDLGFVAVQDDDSEVARGNNPGSES